VAGQQLYAPSAAFPGGLAVEPGYGYEFTDNVRGNKKNVDIYMVTSIRVTYILGATFHKAKFR
jgi:hypothetical protein